MIKMPEISPQVVSKFRLSLTDSDPGVVSVAIQVLLTVADKVDSDEGLPLALLFIQEQILEMKMPKEDLYKNISSPWMQVKLFQLLAKVGVDQSDRLEDVLIRTMEMTNYKEVIGQAIIYEVTCLISKLRIGGQCFQRAVKFAYKFIQSKHNNVRYQGLCSLEKLLTIGSCDQDDSSVLHCISSTDVLLKNKAHSLLHLLATSNNVKSICDLLIGKLRSHDSVDRELIIDKTSNLVNKFGGKKNSV